MSKAYHEANLAHQPFPREAVIELAERARELGVQFKINGIPYGAGYNKELWDRFHGTVEPLTGTGAVVEDHPSGRDYFYRSKRPPTKEKTGRGKLHLA